MESADDGTGRAACEESSMSATAFPSRQEVEDLLYREAALLDEWRLEEWLEMLTDDAIYQVPSTDAPEGDARNTLYIIADDALRIRSRVKRHRMPNKNQCCEESTKNLDIQLFPRRTKDESYHRTRQR